jgi:hypothetical protein
MALTLTQGWFAAQEAHGGIRPLERYNATQIAVARTDYMDNTAYRTDETLDLVHAMLAKHYIGKALRDNPGVTIDTLSCTESAALLGCIYAFEAKTTADLPKDADREDLITDYARYHATTLDFISAWFTKAKAATIITKYKYKYLVIPVTHQSKDAWIHNRTEHAGSHWTLLVIGYNTASDVSNPVTVYHLNSAADADRKHQSHAMRYANGLNNLLRVYRIVPSETRTLIPHRIPVSLTGQQQSDEEEVVSCGIFTLVFMEWLYRIVSNNGSELDTITAWNEFIKYLCVTVPGFASSADDRLYGKYQRPLLRKDLDSRVTAKFTELLANTREINNTQDFLNWLEAEHIVEDVGQVLDWTRRWMEGSFLSVGGWTASVQSMPATEQQAQITELNALVSVLNTLIGVFDAQKGAYGKWRELLIVRDNELRQKIGRILDPSGPFDGVQRDRNAGKYTNAITAVSPPPPSVITIAPAPAGPSVPAPVSPPPATTPTTPPPPVPTPGPLPSVAPTPIIPVSPPVVPALAAKTKITTKAGFINALQSTFIRATKPTLDNRDVNMALFYEPGTMAVAAATFAAKYTVATLQAALVELATFINNNRARIRAAFQDAIDNGFTDTTYDFATGGISTAYARMVAIADGDDFSSAELYVTAYTNACAARINELQAAAAAAAASVPKPMPVVPSVPRVPSVAPQALEEPDVALYSDQYLGRVPSVTVYEQREVARGRRVRNDSVADAYDRAVDARARDEFAAFAEARRAYNRAERRLVHLY